MKRLWDLLDAFAAKNKFSVVVELMNLLAMILHEGRRAGDVSPIDPLLGASLLGKKTWERLCAISKKLCKQEKPFFTSILVAFTQALLFSGTPSLSPPSQPCTAFAPTTRSAGPWSPSTTSNHSSTSPPWTTRQPSWPLSTTTPRSSPSSTPSVGPPIFDDT